MLILGVLALAIVGLLIWLTWTSAPYKVDSTIEVPLAPERVIERMVLVTSARGVHDIAPGSTSMQLSRAINQVWPIVVAVVFFPFGLLALFARGTERATIVATPAPGGSVVTIRGQMERRLFERIDDELTTMRSIGQPNYHLLPGS